MPDTTTASLPTITPLERSPRAARFPVVTMGVLSLTLALSVTAESLPAAIMPQMAASLDADNLQIGMLLSVWAMTVIIASIPLTRMVRRIDRRLVVTGSLVVFALASGATAIAPTYEIVLATRVVAAAAHGLLWSVVIVYATAILEPRHLGRGLAIVSGGVTIALAAGLPAGAAIAVAADWRIPFLGIAVLMGGLALVVARFLPRVHPEVPPQAARAERTTATPRRDATRAPVIVLLAVALVFGLGHFTFFAYITPYLANEAAFNTVWTGPVLALYGVAGFIGLIASGIVVDRWPSIALPVTFAGMALAVTALANAPGSPGVVVAGIVVWGVAMGAMSPLVQTALMRTASPQLRAFASSTLVVAFNGGIAAGSWLGGVIESTADTTVNAAVAGIASAASVVLVLIAQKLAVRARS